jgi:hypothetical protein
MEIIIIIIANLAGVIYLVHLLGSRYLDRQSIRHNLRFTFFPNQIKIETHNWKRSEWAFRRVITHLKLSAQSIREKEQEDFFHLGKTNPKIEKKDDGYLATIDCSEKETSLILWSIIRHGLVIQYRGSKPLCSKT